jgi:PAS domain S-box-containing protein
VKALMSEVREYPMFELEKSFLECQSQFQSLADNSNVAIAATDTKGRFIYVNKPLADLLGYSTQELLGTEFKKYLHPDDRGQIIALFLNIMVLKRQPQNIEFKALRKDGTTLNLISKPSKLVINGKTIGFLAIILDVTEQKRIEEELRKSESTHKNTSEFLNNILSNMLDYVFIIDEDYAINYLNDSAKKVYGNLIGQKCYKATRNLDQPCHNSGIKCEVLEVIKKGNAVFEDTRKMDLHGRIAHVRAKPIHTTSKNKQVMIVVRDVTEEKKSKEELGKSLSLLQTTFESTADGILVTDLNRKIKKYNQRFIKILKIPDHILKSKDDNKVVEYLKNKMKDPKNFVKKIDDSFSNPERESFDLLEFKDDRIIERYTRPQRLNDKVIGRVLSFRDMTERKRMEEELKNYSENLAKMVQNKTRELAISERLLQTTIENVPDHVYIKSREQDSNKGFKFIYANDSYRKFHNKTN